MEEREGEGEGAYRSLKEGPGGAAGAALLAAGADMSFGVSGRARGGEMWSRFRRVVEIRPKSAQGR